MLRFGTLLILAFILSASAVANASQGFTYQGRFFNADGTLPLLDTVDLTLEILAPDEQCVLYSETITGLDLSLTYGFFSVEIGTAVGDTRRNAGRDPGKTMAQVFTNSPGSSGPAPLICPNGYTPSTGDARKLKVVIFPHSGEPIALNPNLTISTVPQALVAETLRGLAPADFIQKTTDVTQPNIETLVGGANASLLHRHDDLYAKLGDAASFSSLTITGSPTNATDACTKGYADGKLGGNALDLTGLGDGQSVKWDAGSSKWVAFSPQSVSLSVDAPLAYSAGNISIAAASGVSSGAMSSGHYLDLQNATSAATASTLVKRDASGNFAAGTITAALSGNASTATAVAWSGITSKPTTLSGYGITDSLVANSGGTPSIQSGADAAKPGPGTVGRLYVASDTQKIYRDDGAGWVVMATSGGSGGTITGVTASGPLASSGGNAPNLTIAKADGSTDGYLDSADWTVFNNKQDSVWGVNGSDLYLASGSVGIGTTSPGSTLDVKGTLRLSGSTSGYVAFTPPAAASSTTYTLPGVPASDGQVLSSTTGGVLSWVTPAEGITALTGDVSASGSGSVTASISAGTVTGKALTGLSTAAGGTVAATDSILAAFGKLENRTALNDAKVGFTQTLARGSVSASAPLAMDVNGAFSIPAATSVADGYMSASFAAALTNATNNSTGNALVKRDASGNFSAGTISATLSGNASTATTLAANGGNCSAGQYPLGVDASGAAESCTDVVPSQSGNGGKFLTTDGTTVSWGSFSGGLPSAVGSAAAPGYSFATDSNTGMFGPAADEIGFAVSGSEKVRIASSGSVGIGTTNPATNLEISAGLSSGSGEILSLTNTAAGGGSLRVGVGATGTTIPAGVVAFGTPASGYSIYMKAGKVGIGAASPTDALEVNGSIRAWQNVLALQYLLAPTFADTGGLTYSHIAHGGSSKFIKFSTDNAERVRINSVGNVGIGTTSPGARLEVRGATPDTETNLVLSNSDLSNFVGLFPGQTSDPNAGMYWKDGTPLRFATATGWDGSGWSEKMRITDLGKVGIGTTNPTATLDVVGTAQVSSGITTTAVTYTSDRRLKTDIVPLSDSLDRILQLEGVRYYWKDPSSSRSEQIGLIAQDVQKVFPQAVNQRPDGFLGVNYAALVSPIIEAVKEMFHRFTSDTNRLDRGLASVQTTQEDLKSQVDALRKENTELKDRLERIERLLSEPKKE